MHLNLQTNIYTTTIFQECSRKKASDTSFRNNARLFANRKPVSFRYLLLRSSFFAGIFIPFVYNLPLGVSCGPCGGGAARLEMPSRSCFSNRWKYFLCLRLCSLATDRLQETLLALFPFSYTFSTAKTPRRYFCSAFAFENDRIRGENWSFLSFFKRTKSKRKIKKGKGATIFPKRRHKSVSPQEFCWSLKIDECMTHMCVLKRTKTLTLFSSYSLRTQLWALWWFIANVPIEILHASLYTVTMDILLLFLRKGESPNS